MADLTPEQNAAIVNAGNPKPPPVPAPAPAPQPVTTPAAAPASGEPVPAAAEPAAAPASVPPQAPPQAAAPAAPASPTTAEPATEPAHSPIVAAFLAANPTPEPAATPAPPAAPTPPVTPAPAPTMAQRPTPPAIQAPGMEAIAATELANAQIHHDKEIFIRTYGQSDPIGMHKAIEQNNEEFRGRQAEVAAQRNAATEQSNSAAVQILQGIRENTTNYQKQNEYSHMIDNPALFNVDMQTKLHAQQHEILKGTSTGDLRDRGAGYFDVTRRLLAPALNPDGTPNTDRITDYSQLQAMAQPDANGFRWLTDTGLQEAAKDLDHLHKPETQGELQDKNTQLAVVKHDLTFDDDKIPDPGGDDAYARAMPSLLAYWNSAQRHGDENTGKVTDVMKAIGQKYARSPAQFQADFMAATNRHNQQASDNHVKESQYKAAEQMLNPKGKDESILNPNGPRNVALFTQAFEDYWRSPQRRQDQANNTVGDMTTKIAGKIKYPDDNALYEAMKANEISKEDGEKIAIYSGWIKPKPKE